MVEQERAVGQAGQRVVERLVRDLFLEPPPLGDVACGEHESSDVGIVEPVDRDDLHQRAGPVAVVTPHLVGQRPAGARWRWPRSKYSTTGARSSGYDERLQR